VVCGGDVQLQVVSPYTQETLRELPYDDAPSVERKLDAARRAFEAWRRLPLAARAQEVMRGLAYFRSHAEEIARDISQEMGKPIREARRELNTFFDRAAQVLELAPAALAPDVLPPKEGFHRRIEHVPLGIVLDIAAWNYPLLIPVNVIVPALLAGNTVLLKHSARTPRVGVHFERAFGALVPGGLVSNLILSHPDTALLLGDRRVAEVAFTGSVEGGHEVYREAARRFVEVGLELGGKDPAYVAEDADLPYAIENVVDGACYNAGQSCCAVERVYVHERLYSDFLAGAREVLGRYRLGDPLDEETTMGPLASRSAVTNLELQVEDAVRRGGRVLCGGRRLDGKRGNFFLPTLLADVPNDALVMQEESFGPIVPVRSVKDDDEAMALMNDTRFGLTASVWTRDADRAERFARDLEAGTIFQNRCDYLDPALPWTGVRDSGKGSTLSRYGFLQLTRRKSIHFRTKT
jgi:acyl-CoA reductase-like NAD-dependent aldehyde dehydrogenase